MVTVKAVLTEDIIIVDGREPSMGFVQTLDSGEHHIKNHNRPYTKITAGTVLTVTLQRMKAVTNHIISIGDKKYTTIFGHLFVQHSQDNIDTVKIYTALEKEREEINKRMIKIRQNWNYIEDVN